MSTANGKKYFANEFVVTGGTSSDYLMGDGTLSTGASGNTTIGTDTDLTTSGATVVDDINLTDGVVTAHSTRTLTLADLGFTGDTDASADNHYLSSVSFDTANAELTFNRSGLSALTSTVRSLEGAPLSDINTINDTRGLMYYNSFSNNPTGDIPGSTNNANGVLTMVSHSGPYAKQIAFGDNDDLYIRKTSNNVNGTWREVYHDGNFTDNSSNWNTAHGWGDHSAQGYISSVTGDWTGTFDGQEGSYYLDYNNFTNTPTIPSAYTHPTHNGDDISVDTGALTGAVVISDLDFNVTTDTLGHVTDANAAISTRTLTLANLGFTGDADANNYVLPFTDNSSNWNTAFGWGDHSTEGYVTSSGNTTIGTDTDINTSGFNVIDSINMTDGVITSTSSRALLNLSVEDTRAAEKTPNDYLEKALSLDFTDEFGSLGSWWSGITVKGWSDNYQAWQLISGSDTSADTALYFRQGVGTSWGAMNEIWHSGRDGSGSGLDADKLDAQEGSYYLDYNNFTNTPTIPSSYTHPTHAGDDINIDTTALTGATVISDLDLNVTTDTLGHVTDANATVATRTLTLADLGFTGDTDANNTTARTDEEIRDIAAAQWIDGANTTVVYDDAANTIKINAPAGGVVDGSGVQNYLVKWTDSDTLTDSIMHETNDRVGINVIQTNATFAVSKTGDETMLFEPNVSNGGRNQIGNLDMSNGSYVGMNWNALDHQIQTSGVTKLTIGSTTIETPNTIEADGFIKDGGTSSQYLMADGSVSTGGGSIDGSGTANMITKWTDADTLEDSNIFENASGDVLINSTTIGDGALNVYQTTTDPSIHLVTDDAGASAGPIIKMERDSSSPADDDLLGKIEFVGKDSGGSNVVYGQMQGYIHDTTVGSTLRGGFKLQGLQDTTMYTNLETVGSRGYLHNNWYVNDDLIITSAADLNIETGATIQLNNSFGQVGKVLTSQGSSTPTWEAVVHSDATEGGTGSVTIGNMVKITQSAYDSLGSKDADTIYMIVG